MRTIWMKARTFFALVLAVLILVMSVSAGDGAPVVMHHVNAQTEGQGTVLLVDKTGQPCAVADYTEGSEVYFQLLPADDYELHSIWVKDAAGADVVWTGDVTRAFHMPGTDVLIQAVFAEQKTEETVEETTEETVENTEHVAGDLPEEDKGDQTVGQESVLVTEPESESNDGTALVPESAGNDSPMDVTETEQTVEQMEESESESDKEREPADPDIEEAGDLTESESEPVPETETATASATETEPETETEDEAEEKPYFISEDFDYSPYQGLDYSSMRLIIGTNDPSVFVDDPAPVSQLNGLYLLQFPDTETTMKAYAYYLQKVPLVEIDGKVMAVNDGAFQDGSGIMEFSDPFVKAQEAVNENGYGAYDIALIDTGANGYVTSAVSVIGDYAGDDNGHGTRMAQMMLEQNPNARILSVKAFESNGMADLSAIYAAFQYAMMQNVKIISISATAVAADSSILLAAISAAVQSGCTVVASAGNNGRDAGWYVPAGLSQVVTIGACDETGVRLDSSNYGACVEYNVVAASTSEAAARFAGWLSANGSEMISTVLNQGLIFETSFEPETEVTQGSLLDALHLTITKDPTLSGIETFLNTLSAAEAQDLYTMLSEYDFYGIWNIIHEDLGLSAENVEDYEVSRQYMNELFHLNQAYINTQPNTNVVAKAYQGARAIIGDMAYTIITERGEYTAYCSEATEEGPSQTMVTKAKLLPDDDLRKGLYLLSPEGPLYGSYDFSMHVPGISNVFQYAGYSKEAIDGYIAHVVGSYWSSGDYGGEQWDATVRAQMQQCANDVLQMMKNNPTLKAACQSAAAYLAEYYTYEVEYQTPIQDMTWTEADVNGFLYVEKKSSDATLVIDGTDYSLEGAVYGVYTDAQCTEEIAHKRLTTGTGGVTATVSLPYGTYYIREISPSPGFLVNTGIQKVTVEKGQTTKVTSEETPDYKEGFLYVRKVSADPALTNGNGVYSLVGAKYGVYTDAACQGTPVATLTTDETGKTETVKLREGPYYVKELSASAGFLVDVTKHGAAVTGNQTTTVTSTEQLKRGGIGLTKLITDTSDTLDGNVNVAGVRFAVVLSGGKNQKAVDVPAGGNRYSPGQVVAVLTTNHEGKASTGQRDLPYGYYDVYELSRDSSVTVGSTWTSQEPAAPQKPANQSGVLYGALHTQIFVDTDNVCMNWNVKNDVVYGYIKITKNDADRTSNQPQGDGSLAGIRYAIVNRSANKVSYPAGTAGAAQLPAGTVVDVLTTDPNGQAVSGKLPYGTYDVIELRADSSVTKGSAWKENGSSLYANQAGYLYAAQSKTITVDTHGKTYDALFTNRIARGGVKISKILEELNAAETEGCSSLSGITFSVVNASDYDVYVGGSWYSSIADRGSNGSAGYTRNELIAAVGSKPVIVATMTTDALGKASLSSDTLPYGTYYIYEERSNASMQIDQDWLLRMEVRADGEVIDASSTPAKDPIVRGDLQFKKVDIDGSARGGIPFLIVSYDTSGNALEFHVIVSDANGDIDTAARDNTNHTNGMDAYVSFDASTGQYVITEEGEALLESGEAAEYGIWFSRGMDPETGEETGNDAPVTDSRGALYYGNYRVFEIKCRDNEEKGEDLLMSPVIPVTEKQTDQDEHGHVIGEHSDITVNFRTFVELEVGLRSEALDTTTGTHVASLRHDTAISDRIHYTHLKADSMYKWVIDFVLTDHPSTVLSSVVVDGYVPKRSSANVQTTDGSFTVSMDGTISGDFTGEPAVSSTGKIDTTVFEGRQISAIVYLYLYTVGGDFSNGSTASVCDFITSHNTDVSDTNEMVYVPSMKTTASDPLTGDHVGVKSREGGIVDQVTMTGLISGGYYMLEATAVDQMTKEVLEGTTPVSKAFYSGWSAQTAVPLMVKTMPEIPVDSSVFENQTVTIFETLWRIDEDGNKLDEAPVMIHESLADEDQSIHYPGIDTNAVDTSTGNHLGQVAEETGGTTTVEDTVHVTNMIPGMEYTIRGKLVYKQDCTDANGIAHTAGEEIPSLDGSVTEQTFIAQDESGFFTISYVVDSSGLEGLSAVSTEYAYHNDVEVASHVDLEDEDQTVHFPKIRTTLTDSKDGEHDAFADAQIALTDTVAYDNLVPGLLYTLKGALFHKSTGKQALDDHGKEIIAEVTFTPERASGTVDLTFIFHGETMAEYSLVAFETLICDGIDVARHQNLEDEAQTVHIPAIATTLGDRQDGGHDALAADNITLTDHVVYKNLLPGKEYVLKGVLMDLQTGEKALDDAGHEIAAQATFTPEASDGMTEVVFAFSGRNLAGKTVAAFEELYKKGKRLAVHADLKDEAQTLWLPKIATTLTDSPDGEKDARGSSKVVLEDTVRYENVCIGETYEVHGYLVDQATGQPAKDDQGNLIEGSASFQAKETSGTVQVAFQFSGESLKGKTLIAFEILYRNGKAVAAHCVLEDFDQSIFLPGIATVLKNSEGGKVVYAAENITLTDTVTYKNLLPGMQYEVTGVLMDQETGEPLHDDQGKEVRAKTSFEPAAPEGTVEVKFTFAGKTLEGKHIVAFEDLYREGRHVAVHADIRDADQTVSLPSIRTTLLGDGGVKTVCAGSKVTLTDTILYKSLVPGTTYLAKGRLMIQATGKPLCDAQGNEVTAEQTFVPDAADGSVDVTFTFDMPAGISWRVVAFETLMEGITEVAKHEDLQDESQIVNVLSLRTKAVFPKGVKRAPNHEDQMVIDKIRYDCLEPGVYTIKTALINKADGSPVMANGMPVKQTKAVKLEKPSGTVSITITVPAGVMSGDMVVFEEFIKEGTDGREILVGEHKDLQDQDQTVTLYPGQKPARKNTPVRTGDENNALLWIILAITALTAITSAVLLITRKRHRG